MNNIKICDKCEGTNIKTLVPKIKKISAEIEVEIGCYNFCGIGMSKSVCILNDVLIAEATEDELIQRIRANVK